MRIFAGNFKNRNIQAPKGLATRPTSGRMREALFNICRSTLDGAKFLDLFAGSGAMGLEALSQGAKFATFVDSSKDSVNCIKENVQLLKVENSSQIIYGDVFEAIERFAKRGASFDIIFADPPYEKRLEDEEEFFSIRLLKLFDKYPSLLASGGSLFLEDTPQVLPKEELLDNLVLNSFRTMGKSALQHYLRKDDTK